MDSFGGLKIVCHVKYFDRVVNSLSLSPLSLSLKLINGVVL